MADKKKTLRGFKSDAQKRCKILNQLFLLTQVNWKQIEYHPESQNMKNEQIGEKEQVNINTKSWQVNYKQCC